MAWRIARCCMYQKTGILAIRIIKELLQSGRYRGLLLDLDNTVYPYEPAHQAALAFCRQQFRRIRPEKADAFDQYYLEARNMVHRRLKGQAAMHSRLLYFQQMFELMFASTDPGLTLLFEAHYWDHFMENMQADEGIMKLIDLCGERDIAVCIVTDLTAQIQHKKLKHLGIDEKIRFMVSSEESGIEKPAREIFDLALQKLGMQPSEVLMVGDSESKDIRGAESLGIQSIRYVAIHH